jgi:hypothetical protein
MKLSKIQDNNEHIVEVLKNIEKVEKIFKIYPVLLQINAYMILSLKRCKDEKITKDDFVCYVSEYWDYYFNKFRVEGNY